MAHADRLKILILEDEVTDAELCERELARAGIACELHRVDHRPAFEAALRELGPDLIISDFSLPTAFDGLHALELARVHLPDVPFVFVSGTIGEERAVEAMKRGATDYVLKDRLQRLGPVVQRAVTEAADRRARRSAEGALAEAKSRLDSILQSITDAVWSILPPPQRGIYANPAVERIWGRPPSWFEDGETWITAVVAEDQPRVASAWRRMIAEGAPFDAEFRIHHGDGSLRWLHTRARRIHAQDGAVERIDCLSSDVTLRKRHEARIARLSRIRAMLSGITSLIVRERNREKLFDTACRIAVEQAGFRLAWIGMLDSDNDRLVPQARRGDDTGYLDAIGIMKRRIAGHPGVAALAIRSRRPVISNDLAADERIIDRGQALSRGYRAAAALPLLVEGTAAGVMVLYAGERGFFDDEETKLLEELAGDIAFALDHIAKTERLDYLAYYDGLTGLPNRKLYFDRLERMLASRSGNDGAAAVVLDVQNFHAINDALGTPVGDAVLQQLAVMLRGVVPAPDLFTRLGADRFAFAVADVSDGAGLVHVLEERVFPATRGPIPAGKHEVHVDVRAGMALSPGDAADGATLVRNAETALQSARRDGVRYRFYEPRMNRRVASRLILESRLRAAVRDREFVLHYQPCVDLASESVVGLEALLRWMKPGHGLVAPGEFMHVLEESGLIVEVGAWVVREALAQCVRWRAQGLEPPRVAVNVSAVQLRQPDYLQDVLAAVAASGGDPKWLALEITESMLMDSIDDCMTKLKDARAAGIDILVDDFGTGYSSLNYLVQLPVSALKIDKSFVAHMLHGERHRAIVATVIALARNLNLKVVAEGIEREEQARILRQLRCDGGQGYLFDRAMPADEVASRIAHRGSAAPDRASGR